jgi:predicted methyltransferase
LNEEHIMYKIQISLFALLMATSNFLFAGEADNERLASVVAAQSEEMQARYVFRHPQETLEFFGIAPGMTVVEALPGGGWYSKILVPYIGQDGRLIGADYSGDMYPLFGFFSDEQLAEKKTFVQDFPTKASAWAGDDGAPASAFELGLLPEEMKGTADAVLFIRALHNLARFEGEGGFLSAALQNAYDVLKPGGIVGVVQHQARDEKPDEFADGSHGYLKREFLVAKMADAGFEFVAESDINMNEKDQPADTDIEWRLPPSFATSRDNPELKAELEAIGESNRMTLKFRKPE